MFLELREEKKAPPPVKTKGIELTNFVQKPHYTGIFDILICAVEQFDDSDTDSDSNDDLEDDDDGMSPILLKV